MRVFVDANIVISAILSDSDILITGDRDFKDVEIKKPLIITPSEYLELIDK